LSGFSGTAAGGFFSGFSGQQAGGLGCLVINYRTI